MRSVSSLIRRKQSSGKYTSSMYSDTYKVQNQFSVLPNTIQINPLVHLTAVGWLPLQVTHATMTSVKYHHIKYEMFDLYNLLQQLQNSSIILEYLY